MVVDLANVASVKGGDRAFLEGLAFSVSDPDLYLDSSGHWDQVR